MSNVGKIFEITNNIYKILNIKPHIKPFGNNPNDTYYYFRNGRNRYKLFKGYSLSKYMKKIGQYNSIYRAIHPDEAILNEYNRKLILIEKKCQHVTGSADEKIGLGDVKLFNFNNIYKNYDITYVYILNDWFKRPKYKLEHDYYATNNKVHIFYNTDPLLKEKIEELIY